MLLITTHKNDKISFKLLEYEKNKNRYYLSIRVDASINGFSGFSEFWTDNLTISNFIKSLELFYKELKGSPALTCGWDNIIYFEMRFELLDRWGHIGLKLTIANPISNLQTISDNGLQLMNRLYAIAELETNELEKFIIVFKSLLNNLRISV